VIAEKPDLVIIAFGMNDPVSSEQFQRTNLEILTRLQKEIPQADLIFVSGMNNNPAWRDPTKIPGFREALKSHRPPQCHPCRYDHALGKIINP
jgi:lysophospholipase L1-like esterase